MSMPTWEIQQGDVLDRLRSMDSESVHCVVTSPPYWGLRDYGLPPTIWDEEEGCEHQWGETLRAGGITGGDGDNTETMKASPRLGRKGRNKRPTSSICTLCGAWRGVLGLEPTIQMYVRHLVDVFKEVWRVLRDDGTFWLNLGDSYAGSGGAHNSNHANPGLSDSWQRNGVPHYGNMGIPGNYLAPVGLKPKSLIGQPWRVAFALQDDGWILRAAPIWFKPNPMPESVKDRPTSAYEMVFLLTKQRRYFYDSDAMPQPSMSGPSDVKKMAEGRERIGGKHKTLQDDFSKASAATNIGRKRAVGDPRSVNLRNVWPMATQGFKSAHFATFPEELPRRCILLGTSEKGVCAECGAPWSRMTVRHDHGWDGSLYGERVVAVSTLSGGTAKSTLGSPHGAWTGKTQTLGWQPTCACNAEVTPAIVLDPFAGAGTTGLVALRHGRSFVGIELSAKYAEMARQRIIAGAPLLNTGGNSHASTDL